MWEILAIVAVGFRDGDRMTQVTRTHQQLYALQLALLVLMTLGAALLDVPGNAVVRAVLAGSMALSISLLAFKRDKPALLIGNVTLVLVLSAEVLGLGPIGSRMVLPIEGTAFIVCLALSRRIVNAARDGGE